MRTRWGREGAHKAGSPGVPATGRRAATTGTAVFRSGGGKTVEGWSQYDRPGPTVRSEAPEPTERPRGPAGPGPASTASRTSRPAAVRTNTASTPSSS